MTTTVTEKISGAHLAELEEMAKGYETSAYAEGLLVKALEPHRQAFHADDRDDKTMRGLRVQLDAEATVRRSTRSAEAIRAALAALRG